MPSDDQLRDALARRPDLRQMEADLASLFAAVDQTRQRRQLTVRIATRWAWPRSAIALLALLAMLVVLVIALVLFAGSRHRLPEPFGLAKPGLIAFDVEGGIAVARQDGSDRRQLTLGGRFDYGEVFSPDGTRIAYASEGEDMTVRVIVMDADGGHPMIIGGGFSSVGRISWSPDSAHLAVDARIVGGPQAGDDSRIFVGPVEPSGLHPLGFPDLHGDSPTWSPDGTTIAFIHFAPCCGGPEPTLALIDVAGTHIRLLVEAPNGGDPEWSPDGKRLAYLANGVNASQDVYVIGTNGSPPRDITKTTEEEQGIAWSPDGTRIAFTRGWTQYSNRASIVIASPDGSGSIVLRGPDLNDNAPIWSPDGSLLLGFAFATPKDVGANDQPWSDLMIAFDPLDRSKPSTFPFTGFVTASWQRLAP